MDSEEGRVGDVRKMVKLHELRDFVFRDRVDKFHWELSNSVETEHVRYQSPTLTGNTDGHKDTDTPAIADHPEPEVQDTVGNDIRSDEAGGQRDHNLSSSNSAGSSYEPATKVDYPIGSFVVVQAALEDAQKKTKYWVGKVVAVEKKKDSGYVVKLRVHWHDDDNPHRNCDDMFTYKFHPCYRAQKRKKRRVNSISEPCHQELQQPWCGRIHTDTVVVCFNSPAKGNTLPLSFQKKLP